MIEPFRLKAVLQTPGLLIEPFGLKAVLQTPGLLIERLRLKAVLRTPGAQESIQSLNQRLHLFKFGRSRRA